MILAFFRTFIVLSVFIATPAIAAELLHSHENDAKTIELHFDRASKNLTIDVKTRSRWRRNSRGERHEFNINNIQEIDSHIAHATSILQALNLPNETIESFISYFDSFKFVSTANCQAIHLGEEVSQNTQVIEDLAREFDRISAGIRGEGEFERSINIYEFTIADVGVVQVRALVDSQNRPVKLSIAKKDGTTLKDYKVERQDDRFTIFHANGEPIVSIENHKMENKFISVYEHVKTGLDTTVRVHLRLDHQDNKLTPVVLSVSRGAEGERVGSVALTTTTVDHQPVMRNSQMDIFIPTLSVDDLSRQIQTIAFGSRIAPSQKFIENGNEFFDNCLSERYVLRQELGNSKTDDQLLNECLSLTALEYTHESLNDAPEKQADFHRCLGEINALSIQGNDRQFKAEFFLDREASRSALRTCVSRLQEFDVRQEISTFLKSQNFQTDESYAPLLGNIEQVALNVYRSCSGDDCASKALSRVKVEMHKFKYLHWFNEASHGTHGIERDRLVARFVSCSSSNEIIKCQRELLESSVKYLPASMYDRILDELGIKVAASDDDRLAITSCLETNLARLQSHDFAAVDEWHYKCSFDHLKSKFSTLVQAHWASELSAYGMSTPVESIDNLVRLEAGSLVTTMDAKNLITKAGVVARASAIDRLLQRRMARSLPSEESDEGAEIRRNIQETLSTMTQPGTFNLVESSTNYLSRSLNSHGERGVKTAFRDLAMRTHLVPRKYEILNRLSQSSFSDAVLEEKVTALNREYEECWRDFDANGSSDLLAHALDCDKASLAREQYEIVSQEMRDFVSRRFPLNAFETNQILNPLYSMEKCFRDIDDQPEMELVAYERWLKACSDVTRFDIASNMYEKLEEKYRSVLKPDAQAKMRLSLACFVNSVKEQATAIPRQNITRSFDAVLAQSNQLVGAGSLLSLMTLAENPNDLHKVSDRRLLQNLLKNMAQNEDSTNLLPRLEACASDFDQNLTTGFTAYLRSSVPNLFNRMQPNLSRSQQQVVEHIFDTEMVELLLEVQRKNEYRVSASDGPGSTIVTADFSIEALARFITGMGTYLGQGFVFDLDEMKTELVIFKEELKDALLWIAESNEPVPVSELKRFFGESKLADIMALAHVAKNTNDNFTTFLTSMETSEVSDFWSDIRRSHYGHQPWITARDETRLSTDARAHLRSIRAKYVSLKNISHRMTTGYEFRRIFNVHSQEGQRALNLIKETDFLPRLEGRTPSATNQEQINRAIADRILNDNTPGGFTESFVRVMAQEYLDKQSAGKWGITKWLFYDTGDFSWATLRSTASGRKAIEYYGRYILLPKMLGQRLSTYSQNLHKTKFEELIRDAQSENQ